MASEWSVSDPTLIVATIVYVGMIWLALVATIAAWLLTRD